jgi:hypothetical protein
MRERNILSNNCSATYPYCHPVLDLCKKKKKNCEYACVYSVQLSLLQSLPASFEWCR